MAANKLYYSIQPVNFTKVGGSTLEYGDNSTFLECDKDVTAPSYITIDKDQKCVLVHDVPGRGLRIRDVQVCRNLKDIPQALRHPWLKSTDDSSASTMIGYVSGRRSGLVHIEGKWYRLKGCGDQTSGIIPRIVADSKDGVELRGCMFPHTAARELHMTSLINTHLRANNITPANESVGWWDYETEWPVTCSCAIFKTNGDRRLGDHVLMGLESLLPLIVDEQHAESVIDIFPKSRFEAGVENLHEALASTWIIALEDRESEFVDISTRNIYEHAPVRPPPNLPSDLQALWDANCDVIKKYTTTTQASSPSQTVGDNNTAIGLLWRIYWRVGWEAGRVVRVLKDARISWGTYEDELGMHCNAHPNNLILLDPDDDSHSHNTLLAPLDFDMTFCIDETTNSANNTTEESMYLEMNALRLTLGGDVAANTGFRGFAELSPPYSSLRWALRDTLIIAYNKAYRGDDDDDHPQPLPAAAHALLRLALIATADRIA